MPLSSSTAFTRGPFSGHRRSSVSVSQTNLSDHHQRSKGHAVAGGGGVHHDRPQSVPPPNSKDAAREGTTTSHTLRAGSVAMPRASAAKIASLSALALLRGEGEGAGEERLKASDKSRHGLLAAGGAVSCGGGVELDDFLLADVINESIRADTPRASSFSDAAWGAIPQQHCGGEEEQTKDFEGCGHARQCSCSNEVGGGGEHKPLLPLALTTFDETAPHQHQEGEGELSFASASSKMVEGECDGTRAGVRALFESKISRHAVGASETEEQQGEGADVTSPPALVVKECGDAREASKRCIAEGVPYTHTFQPSDSQREEATTQPSHSSSSGPSSNLLHSSPAPLRARFSFQLVPALRKDSGEGGSGEKLSTVSPPANAANSNGTLSRVIDVVEVVAPQLNLAGARSEETCNQFDAARVETVESFVEVCQPHNDQSSNLSPSSPPKNLQYDPLLPSPLSPWADTDCTSRRVVPMSRDEWRRQQKVEAVSMLAFERASLRQKACQPVRDLILDCALGRVTAPPSPTADAKKKKREGDEGQAKEMPPISSRKDEDEGAGSVCEPDSPSASKPASAEKQRQTMLSVQEEKEGGGEGAKNLTETLSAWVAKTFMPPTFFLDAHAMGRASIHYRQTPLVRITYAMQSRGEGREGGRKRPLGETVEASTPTAQGTSRSATPLLLSDDGERSLSRAATQASDAAAAPSQKRLVRVPSHKGILEKRREQLRYRMKADAENSVAVRGGIGGDSVEDSGVSYRVAVALNKNPYHRERLSPFTSYALGKK